MMTRLERRVLIRSLAIGGLLTLMVLGVWMLGWLDSLEYWLYDQRAIHCQLAEPAPTDRIVHFDIDDASVSRSVLGRWPWPRAKLAKILDEIHRAAPSAVGLDIMFADPQDVEYKPDADGHFVAEDEDDTLTQSLRRCRNAVIAASFKVEPTESEADGPPEALQWLTENLEMSETDLARRLESIGYTQTAGRTFDDMFVRLRRRAVKTRIEQELDQAPAATTDQLASRLLPRGDSQDQALSELFADQYALSLDERSLLRFGAPLQTMDPPPLQGTLNVVPLRRFSSASAGCAFANYDIFDNATVRAVPLYVQYRKHLFPQMGLATACVMLGADPASVRFDGSQLIIPTRSGNITIPTYIYHSTALGQDIPIIAAVPWFGSRDWETMYDWPDHRNIVQHFSVASIWNICTNLQKLTVNAKAIEVAVNDILGDGRGGFDPDLARKYAANPPDPTDADALEKMARGTLQQLKDSGWMEMFAQTADKDLPPDERKQKDILNDAVNALNVILPKNRYLRDLIDTERKWLASEIAGKGVLIGFTATGSQDQVSTSIHQHCPGVVVHGVIINAVLTGRWWRVFPQWITLLLTIVFGMSAAAIQGRFQPLRAWVMILALLLAYGLINGFILFDWHRWVIGLAAPSVAIVVVWAGCTLDRLRVEQVERNRVALENAVISKEMDLARNVQVALIPPNAPKITGLESDGWALTASVTGGDCYDLWQLKDGRLAVLLADASGHGLAPAMIVSQVRTLARTLCEFETHPHGLLARINRRLADDLETTRFVTAFLGFVGVDGTLDWASAGHGPMFWSPGDNGQMLELDSTGLPLGIMPECFIDDPQPSLKLGEKGSLIVFSDGIFESHAPDGQMFGVARTKEILEQTSGQPCSAIVAALRAAVQKWQQKIEPEDDQTIVAVRRVVD